MDPQQQQTLNTFAGLGFGIIAFVFLFVLAIFAFFIYLYWRILKKAGLAPGLAFLAIPIVPLGPIIVLCIIAFSEWKVVPANAAYANALSPYPPAYPPASYPPSNLPPTGPTQL